MTVNPTPDPRILEACECLLDDHTVTLLGLPYRFGEIRTIAADVVAFLRASMGILVDLEVEGLMQVFDTNAVCRMADSAGVERAGNGVEGMIATLESLIEGGHVPRRDCRWSIAESPLSQGDDAGN